jgi:Domain of unknown function (DUF4388)
LDRPWAGRYTAQVYSDSETTHAMTGVVDGLRRYGSADPLALTGTLREFGLIDLLSLVKVTRKSGVLSIRSQAETLDLYFRDGRLIRFTTFPRRIDLGQLLLRSGRVSQDQLDAIPADIASSEKAVAVALMEASGVARPELITIYAAQAGDVIGQALMWLEGVFAFKPEVTLAEDDITFDVDIGTLIDGLRARQDQWRVLRSVLPHLEYRVRFPAARRQRVEPVVLSPTEWVVVTQVGSSPTLDALRQRLKLDEFQIRQSVQRLVSEGLLEIEEARDERTSDHDATAAAEGALARKEPASVGASASPQLARGGFLPRIFGRRGS